VSRDPKDTDFKFGTHALRHTPDMILELFRKDGVTRSRDTCHRSTAARKLWKIRQSVTRLNVVLIL